MIAIKAFQTREVFCDEKSEEGRTNSIKRKYKLAAKMHADLGVFIFVISTSEQSATSKHTTVRVDEHEWEDRHSDYLKGRSFFDAKKILMHSTQELLDKRSDPSNLFLRVAKLPEKLHQDLQNCFVKAKAITSVPKETKDLLEAIFVDTDVPKKALHDLGLN